MAGRGAPALLLQQLSSDAAALVGNVDLVAAARSALQHQTRVVASSPVSSRDMLAELQREAVELASPSKERTALQLHGELPILVELVLRWRIDQTISCYSPLWMRLRLWLRL